MAEICQPGAGLVSRNTIPFVIVRNYPYHKVMGKLEDTIEEKAHWHWRNTMRPVRFFGLDARAAIPYFILLVYFRPISLFLTAFSTVVFVMLEKRGLSFEAAIRAFRSWLIGQKRPGWLPYRRRRMVDFG